MDNEKWAEALNEISDKHLQEAIEPKKHRIPWVGAVAGTVAAAILMAILSPLGQQWFDGPILYDPTTTAPSGEHDTLSPDIIQLTPVPRNQDRSDKLTVFNQTMASSSKRYDFFLESSALILSGSNENVLWSPVNAWLNLAMTARITGGETQQEILTALDATSMDDLTQQASALWESIYVDQESGKCQLANSVWLDQACDYDLATMEALSHDFYTSIYQTDLGTETANAEIRNWINLQTENFLQDAASGIDVPEDAIIAMYSTIYFKGRWESEFHPNNSRDGVFHAPEGETNCTYMNKSAAMGYYWGDTFGAVCLSMKNGAKMWFLLPDEGVRVDQLLNDEDYLMLITDHRDPVIGENSWRDQRRIQVNLSVPKFDISGQVELDAMMQAMGIEKAFDPDTADFSQALPGSSPWLQDVNQAVRVAIDEEGVTAAAFTENIPGAAPPPEDIIDFVLDRPFLFVIERAGVPLFVGVINDPTA